MISDFLLLTVSVSICVDIASYLLLVVHATAARIAAAFQILVLSFITSSLLVIEPSVPIVLFAVMCVFRALNSARIVYFRMNTKELASRFRRSALWLIGYTLLAIAAIQVIISPDFLGYVFYSSLVISIVLLLQTIISRLRWRTVTPHEDSSKQKLPTVSLCIPARNETQDLPECIESALSSTYPKLEILVLDDCSHDKTPAVIKEYAHQGVRFLSGKQPNKGWMAKNAAMNKLFDESTGEVVIFSGVDVRFKPDSITQLVASMGENIEMLSVLPARVDAKETSVFIQPLRYWWELALPRIFTPRPPVLSTCWAIRRGSLKKLGEFDSFRKSVQPEAHFAKRLSHVYRFIVGTKDLGITSSKAPKLQLDTAMRVRYPQLKRRPENILISLLFLAVVFLVPWTAFMYGLFIDSSLDFSLLMSIVIVQIVTNLLITSLAVRRLWIIGFINLPFLALLDMYTLIKSMLAYEFGSVIWKERNICLPMYQVDNTMPKS